MLRVDLSAPEGLVYTDSVAAIDHALDTAAQALLRDLPPLTPVLTGRMKGSWAVRQRPFERHIVNHARNPRNGYPYPRRVVATADSAAGLRRRLANAGSGSR